MSPEDRTNAGALKDGEGYQPSEAPTAASEGDLGRRDFRRSGQADLTDMDGSKSEYDNNLAQALQEARDINAKLIRDNKEQEKSGITKSLVYLADKALPITVLVGTTLGVMAFSSRIDSAKDSLDDVLEKTHGGDAAKIEEAQHEIDMDAFWVALGSAIGASVVLGTCFHMVNRAGYFKGRRDLQNAGAAGVVMGGLVTGLFAGSAYYDGWNDGDINGDTMFEDMDQEAIMTMIGIGSALTLFMMIGGVMKYNTKKDVELEPKQVKAIIDKVFPDDCHLNNDQKEFFGQLFMAGAKDGAHFDVKQIKQLVDLSNIDPSALEQIHKALFESSHVVGGKDREYVSGAAKNPGKALAQMLDILSVGQEDGNQRGVSELAKGIGMEPQEFLTQLAHRTTDIEERKLLPYVKGALQNPDTAASKQTQGGLLKDLLKNRLTRFDAEFPVRVTLRDAGFKGAADELAKVTEYQTPEAKAEDARAKALEGERERQRREAREKEKAEGRAKDVQEQQEREAKCNKVVEFLAEKVAGNMQLTGNEKSAFVRAFMETAGAQEMVEDIRDLEKKSGNLTKVDGVLQDQDQEKAFGDALQLLGGKYNNLFAESNNKANVGADGEPRDGASKLFLALLKQNAAPKEGELVYFARAQLHRNNNQQCRKVMDVLGDQAFLECCKSVTINVNGAFAGEGYNKIVNAVHKYNKVESIDPALKDPECRPAVAEMVKWGIQSEKRDPINDNEEGMRGDVSQMLAIAVKNEKSKLAAEQNVKAVVEKFAKMAAELKESFAPYVTPVLQKVAKANELSAEHKELESVKLLKEKARNMTNPNDLEKGKQLTTECIKQSMSLDAQITLDSQQKAASEFDKEVNSALVKGKVGYVNSELSTDKMNKFGENVREKIDQAREAKSGVALSEADLKEVIRDTLKNTFTIYQGKQDGQDVDKFANYSLNMDNGTPVDAVVDKLAQSYKKSELGEQPLLLFQFEQCVKMAEQNPQMGAALATKLQAQGFVTMKELAIEAKTPLNMYQKKDFDDKLDALKGVSDKVDEQAQERQGRRQAHAKVWTDAKPARAATSAVMAAQALQVAGREARGRTEAVR